jgi:ATP-dependent HslUV protease subunit HslV
MRRLEALMLVADKDRSFLLNGGGDLLTPDPIDSADGDRRQELMSVGSGSNYALSAARALMRHTSLSAIEIAREAMRISAEICVFTNDQVTIEEL